MDAHAQRRINDRDGLTWLARFGWLRTTELGPLLWPNSTARQQADRLARSWLERRLVLARELPERAGRALVLSTAGVRLLAEFGVDAASGKDLGKMLDGEWLPPLTWRHDLLAAGVLVALHRRGWAVYPEREIRQRAGWLAKLPDGIAVRGADVAWLEVERASKTGAPGRQLADALCAVGAGEAVAVLGHRPTVGLVAYQPEAMDSRGCAIDHRARIKAAVAAATKRDVRVLWARCTLRGPAGLGTVEFELETVQADRAAAILKRLEWRPSSEEAGVLVAGYARHLARVWEDDCGWGYQVDDRPGALEATREAAKRACASAIAALY